LAATIVRVVEVIEDLADALPVVATLHTRKARPTAAAVLRVFGVTRWLTHAHPVHAGVFAVAGALACAVRVVGEVVGGATTHPLGAQRARLAWASAAAVLEIRRVFLGPATQPLPALFCLPAGALAATIGARGEVGFRLADVCLFFRAAYGKGQQHLKNVES
jgi:hypothetical protein